MRETLSYALRFTAIIALAIAAVFTRADVASAHFDGADASQFANDGGKDKADKGGHGDRAKDNDHAKAEARSGSKSDAKAEAKGEAKTTAANTEVRERNETAETSNATTSASTPNSVLGFQSAPAAQNNAAVVAAQTAGTVAGAQTAPTTSAGVQNLPSTSTSSETLPLVAFGMFSMLFGAFLLKRSSKFRS